MQGVPPPGAMSSRRLTNEFGNSPTSPPRPSPPPGRTDCPTVVDDGQRACQAADEVSLDGDGGDTADQRHGDEEWREQVQDPGGKPTELFYEMRASRILVPSQAAS
jgi:hypothetical protein